MTDRIHSALDGELRPEELTAAERRMLVSMAAMIEDVAYTLHRVPSPDLSARVMAALPASDVLAKAPLGKEEDRQPAGLGFFGWLWSPRRVELAWRPAYAIAAVLAVAVGIVPVMTALTSRNVAPPVASATREATMYVQFRLDAPGAATVAVSGSFTNWGGSVPLVESAPGVWSTLVALEPGVHDYVFLVDGQTWIADPTAPAVDDGFGGTNSRLFLTRPSGNV